MKGDKRTTDNTCNWREKESSGTRVGKYLLRSTALEGACGNIIEGLKIFDAAVMHVCIFLLIHATILNEIRNITHNTKRVTILKSIITYLPSGRNLHTSTCLVFYRDYSC